MRSKTLRLKKSRKFKKSNRRSRSKRVKRSKKSSRVKGIKRSSRVKGPKRSKRVKRSKMSARSRKRIRGKKRSQRGGMDAAEAAEAPGKYTAEFLEAKSSDDLRRMCKADGLNERCEEIDEDLYGQMSSQKKTRARKQGFIDLLLTVPSVGGGAAAEAAEADSLFDGAGEATEATMAALTAARGKSVEAGKKMEEALKVAYFKGRPPEHLELHNKALEMENGLPEEDWPPSDKPLDLDIRLWLGVQPYLTSGATESLSEDDDDDDDVPFDLDDLDLRDL